MKKLFPILTVMCLCININAQTNLITNGGFEDDFWPWKKPGTTLYTLTTYAEPLRVFDYFDEKTQGRYPDMGTAPSYELHDTRDSTWFLLNPTEWYYARSYVDITSNTPMGEKCITIRYVGYGGSQKRDEHAYTPFKHVVFQRVELNNDSKFKLEFIFQKRDTLTGGAGSQVENKVARFVVGIIAPQELGARESSFHVDVEVPEFGDQAWKEVEVIFDIPEILKDKPYLDFSKCAILFGLQPALGPPHATSGFMSVNSAEIRIDAVNLTEIDASSVRNLKVGEKISVNDKKVYVKQNINDLRIYDVTGSLIFRNSNMNSDSQSVYTFTSAGAYIIYADGETGKFLVK